MKRESLGLAGTVVMLLGALLGGGQDVWAGNGCGDGTCDTDETYCDCPEDCVNDEFSCEPCDCGERGGPAEECWCDSDCVGYDDCCFNACDECGHCPGVCGENGCEPDEDCETCPIDCGLCEGACCLNESGFGVVAGGGTVCEFIGPTECEDRNGVYQGNQIACSPNPCNRGACCNAVPDRPVVTAGDQSCFESSEADCVFSGGQFQGEDTICGQIECPEVGACCFEPNGKGGIVAGTPNGALACTVTTVAFCESALGGQYKGDGTFCDRISCDGRRVSATQKGSLLMFSNVELAWEPGNVAGPGFVLSQDTVIELTNDYPQPIGVQLYFVNGDAPLDPIFAGDPPALVTDGEPGWNWVDCQFKLTQDQPTYWSASTGLPAGCQPFTVLDPDAGSGPGRPDPENPGRRILRGFVYVWAVNNNGQEISWNHLSGSATVIDFPAVAAWEYEAWGFQSHLPHGETEGSHGLLFLDGREYEMAFDMLLMDFFASGSQALSSNGAVVSVDTDLTLHVVSADLRQDSEGPITTKAEFAIWNENERRFSGTTRCITCWDQTMLSRYNAPNHFLLGNLQSDRGKARIDGVASTQCDIDCFLQQPSANSDVIAGILDPDMTCSVYAPILGVSAKELAFSGTASGRTTAGGTLVGQGHEFGYILYDIVSPPGTVTKGLRPSRHRSR